VEIFGRQTDLLFGFASKKRKKLRKRHAMSYSSENAIFRKDFKKNYFH